MTKIGCVHRVPLFNNLACDERSEVQELLYHKTFQKGEIIFSPDDPEQLSIVSAGAMKIYKLSKTGKEQLLSLIHISEPTRRTPISYAVFCLKKKNIKKTKTNN